MMMAFVPLEHIWRTVLEIARVDDALADGALVRVVGALRRVGLMSALNNILVTYLCLWISSAHKPWLIDLLSHLCDVERMRGLRIKRAINDVGVALIDACITTGRTRREILKYQLEKHRAIMKGANR